MIKLFKIGTGIFLLSIMCLVAFSSNSYSGENWDFDLAPYLWFLSMSGDVTVKGQTTQVDASFSDILDDMVFAGQIHFEATRKKGRKFGFWFDGTYAKFESDGEMGPVSVDVESTLALVEAAFFYNIHKWELGSSSANGRSSKPNIELDAVAGLRYWYLDAKLKFGGNGPIGKGGNITGDQDWLDALVGLRSFINFTDKFRIMLRTDFAGFGIASSSDLTWVGAVAIGYSIKSWLEPVVGYRALYLDYENGSGNNRFAMDVWIQNPFVGINFRF